MTEAATEQFITHRNLLFTVVYEVLGSAADAEDVLQETWLRWAGTDVGSIREPRAYLVRIATRLALNRLRTLSRRKETYVGCWLPEPVLTTPDVAEDVELAESVSMALLLVLETLSATERVVFVLHEVFGVPLTEVAESLEKTPAAVRQTARRARAHVQARRPRQASSPDQARAVVEKFNEALMTGDLEALVDVLAPDVVYMADGGGVRTAARHPVVGAEVVHKLLQGAVRIAGGEFATAVAPVNGSAGLLVHLRGTFDGAIAVSVADGLIDALYYVRNPEKLTGLDREAPLVLR
ncbi:MAG TPA: RNA polymerase sigma-70 factor [Ruania sp.]|nr:RNA polymerase sigma-70 factor [Ruania sp.]